MSIGKRLAVGAGTATLALVLGATVLAPLGAGAQESTTPTINESVDPDGPDGTGRVDRIRESLEALVTDGTLTAAQADAVATHLAQFAPGPGHHFRARHHFRIGLGIAAETIGIDVEVLIDALRDGQTLAEVAAANGADAGTVIDALVAARQAKLDELVAAGTITSEEAAQRAAEAVERITGLVNGDFDFRPGFGERPDHEEPAATDGA